MQGMSTNGAGAAEAGAVAGHEGQHGVAGLAFGARGRAVAEGVPDREPVRPSPLSLLTPDLTPPTAFVRVSHS